MSIYELHEHSYISGPNKPRHSDPKRRSDFAHSHPGGDMPHAHLDTGAALFGRNKLTKKPSGPQLDLIEHAPEQHSSFRVIFVDEYTPGHASAGISRERWERERAAFLSIAAGKGEYQSTGADARMVRDYRLTPIYELSDPNEVER